MAAKRIKYDTDHQLFDIHTFDIDLNANHIYLMGNEEYVGLVEGEDEPGVEFSMANRFIRNLNILMRKSGDPILVHMKTCGGHWSEGMAIYDVIRSCPNHVCILSYTHARSMSSLILQAADKRVMMPHSTFMFHDGTLCSGGTVKQFLTEAEEAKKSREQMMKIYVDSMKESGKLKDWSRKKIHNWLRSQMDKKEEVYLDAEQTVEHGFADGVFSPDGEYNWATLLDFEEE